MNDDIIKEIFALQLKSAAMTYTSLFSMRISPVEGNNEDIDPDVSMRLYKNPVDTSDFKIDYDWHKASGLGINLGLNNIWALDIDNITPDKEERKKLISEMLFLLRLPNDYEWVCCSGGGNGIHILLKSQFIGNTKFCNNVLPFSSDKTNMTISLRMNEFLVLPPSLHYSGGKYEFLNGKMPNEEPYYVSADSLFVLFSHYYGKYERMYLRYEIYLLRTALLKEVCYDKSYDEYEYNYNDEIELLKSCHHADALNSLGCLYAKKAMENPECQKEFLKLAKEAFRESWNNDAQNNFKAIIAIEDSTMKESIYSLERYGNYSLAFLQMRRCRYLFIDTETTGLPIKKDVSYEDLDNWPRLVQLSWICVSEDDEIILEENHYIRPIGFHIPEESAKIHGVYTGMAIARGVDFCKVLEEFEDCARAADYIVGHNVKYDINVICAEIIRYSRHQSVLKDHDFDEIFDPEGWYRYERPSTLGMIATVPIIDTMESAVNYCKIPGCSRHYKYPKLQELYKCLFGKEFEGAHNSMADIRATFECFKELKKKGYITVKKRDY